MSSAILTTKLRPPPIPAERAPRPRLHQRLEGGSAGRLTLVSAPAGYGKTTALATWAEWTPAPVAWLSLDEADNAPQRFLRHLVAALQRRDETLRELGDFVGEDLEAALITVVNDIAANEGPLVLALDDYHVVTSEHVHELVRFLLDHAPEQLRIVIASRTDPPLPLARLRVVGSLTEIRTDELRLTVDEAATMLRAQGLELSAEDVEELTLRTEGWPAGLHLAALSLRARDDPHAFIAFFTGTDRFVLEYLTEEVLTRQPPDVQDFLLMTSVLDEFDVGLAAAVTRADDAAAMLELIERNNLFLVPLDARRQRVRYHAFFQDLLVHRLTAARPDLPAELHRRASGALEARGEPDEALLHAVLAADAERVERLLDGHRQGARLRRRLAAALGGTVPRALGRPAEELAPLTATLREALDTSESEEADEEGRDRTAQRHISSAGAEGEVAPEPLSERELEVLRLIAAGLSNKQIARRLNVSLNTVKTHARNIYGKLGVGSRTRAAARARELGLV